MADVAVLDGLRARLTEVQARHEADGRAAAEAFWSSLSTGAETAGPGAPDATRDAAPGAALGAAPGTPAAGGYANAIVVLDATTLQPKDWFTNPSAEFVTTPVVTNVGGREIVAAATRDGRIVLLDAASPGGANHTTPLFTSSPSAANFVPDGLAAFEQPAGTPWLLVPGPRAIVAHKIVSEGGNVSLQPGWTSGEIAAPTAPIVVNDVVFAAASGRPKGAAVLHAFDGQTGRELWNSGKTIESFTTGPGFWSSNSQVYLATDDGTVYAFGYTLERR